jgi:hypothetical protein
VERLDSKTILVGTYADLACASLESTSSSRQRLLSFDTKGKQQRGRTGEWAKQESLLEESKALTGQGQVVRWRVCAASTLVLLAQP